MSSIEFWSWFAANAGVIGEKLKEPSFVEEFDHRIHTAWPDLAWEIGPASHGGLYLALSPNLDRRLAAHAKQVVEDAPTIEGWRILGARPPKAWRDEFELQRHGGAIVVSTLDWRFVYLRHPTGERELVLVGENSADLTEEERWNAAAIVLEGMLGEQAVLENVDEFALVPSIETAHMRKAKPLSALRRLFKLH